MKTQKYNAEDLSVMVADAFRLSAENAKQLDRVGVRFNEVGNRHDKLDERLDRIGEKLDKMCDKVGGIDNNHDKFDERLDRIGEKLDKMCNNVGGIDNNHDKFDERLDRIGEKLDKMCDKVGGIDNNIGHHAEQFFQDTFTETLAFGGEKYDKILKNFVGRSGTVKDTEFDIVLVNGKSVAVIEVKNRIHPKFVKQLAEERLAVFRSLFPEYQKHKVYLGIAGFSFPQKVLEEAKKYGIGIVKQVGQSVEVEAGHLKAY